MSLFHFRLPSGFVFFFQDFQVLLPVTYPDERGPTAFLSLQSTPDRMASDVIAELWSDPAEFWSEFAEF